MIRKLIVSILVVCCCSTVVSSKSYYITDCKWNLKETKFTKQLLKYNIKKELGVNETEIKQIAYHTEKYSRYTKLDKYDIASINIKEAQLNRFAYNKKDGGFGLGQITNYKKDWHQIMPFLKYDKFGIESGVLATCIAINVKANDIKSKNRLNIMRAYNSQSSNGTKYALSVNKISQDLRKM